MAEGGWVEEKKVKLGVGEVGEKKTEKDKVKDGKLKRKEVSLTRHQKNIFPQRISISRNDCSAVREFFLFRFGHFLQILFPHNCRNSIFL